MTIDATPNERTRKRAERRKRARARQEQLASLYTRQEGKCLFCNCVVVLDGNGGKSSSDRSAVRFRLGSSFGAKGRVRRRVMTCRKCSQERSDEIVASQPVEELWMRSRRFPTEFYSLPGKEEDEGASLTGASPS